MPASMISAVTGESAIVMGSSMAIVAVGPMPGSTPTRVPSSTPRKQYSTLTGVNAVSKPSPRLAISSMSPAQPRSDQPQRQAQPDIEYQHAEDGEADRQRDRELQRHAVARKRGHDHDEGDRGDEPETPHRQAENDRGQHDQNDSAPGNRHHMGSR